MLDAQFTDKSCEYITRSMNGYLALVGIILWPAIILAVLGFVCEVGSVYAAFKAQGALTTVGAPAQTPDA